MLSNSDYCTIILNESNALIFPIMQPESCCSTLKPEQSGFHSACKNIGELRVLIPSALSTLTWWILSACY